MIFSIFTRVGHEFPNQLYIVIVAFVYLDVETADGV